MISGAAVIAATTAVATTSSCFTNEHNMYGGITTEDMTTHSNSLLYNLSVLKEKAHQAQSLAFSSIYGSPSDHHHHQNQQQQQQQQSHDDQSTSSMAAGMASVTTLIQEIIVTASSMMYTVQQMSLLGTTTTSRLTDHEILQQQQQQQQHQHQPENIDWYVDHSYNNSSSTINYGNNKDDNNNINRSSISISNNNNTNVLVDNSNVDDIIELNAADILAKYTHYCQICGKGFKRDANLRMHMRAHGDEYKSTSALINPMKKSNASTSSSNNGSKDKEGLLVSKKRKYSCPQEGCRWNRKHVKFQPLKSMICVKNHYKRSHCPKMYVCKRCNQKQFSVLSDLRTHEKHCGDGVKWVCSCGTTFSRKDKLMGHVALFVGHTPIINQ